MQLIDPRTYDYTVWQLRTFFREKGFVEVSTQHLLSILAACENPWNIARFDYAGEVWPLPQTGQMWLEHILLTDPNLPGVYCSSTSYRQEPDPVPGRHDLIFPMFEFETHGDMTHLRKLEEELLVSLGFKSNLPRTDIFPHVDYVLRAKYYETDEITFAHEEQMERDYGPVCFLEYFPETTSPFWNMKRDGAVAKKIDVILYGMETIGSAERSTDPYEMRERFHAISDGGYAKKLFADFGKKRVLKELEKFLQHNFFPRCGGGIGMTRMIRALRHAGKIA